MTARDVDTLRSEVERLTQKVYVHVPVSAAQVMEILKSEKRTFWKEDGELRAEVERMRALLRECEPHINEHYDDGADLCKRIRAALGEVRP